MWLLNHAGIKVNPRSAWSVIAPGGIGPLPDRGTGLQKSYDLIHEKHGLFSGLILPSSALLDSAMLEGKWYQLPSSVWPLPDSTPIAGYETVEYLIFRIRYVNNWLLIYQLCFHICYVYYVHISYIWFVLSRYFQRIHLEVWVLYSTLLHEFVCFTRH